MEGSGSVPLNGSRRSHSLPEVVQLGGGHRVDHELDLLLPVAPGVGLRLLALALQGALNLRQLGQCSLQALPRVPTETESTDSPLLSLSLLNVLYCVRVSLWTVKIFHAQPVLRIRDILERIRIPGSKVPLTTGSGSGSRSNSGSDYFLH